MKEVETEALLNSPAEKVYSLPADLEVLGEVKVPCWIIDFEPGKTRYVWANKACCYYWGKTMEEFLATDLVSESSPPVLAFFAELHEKIQKKHQSFKTRKACYPKENECVMLDMFFRPIRVTMPENTEPINLVLIAGDVVDDGGDDNKTQDSTARLHISHEILRFTVTMTMLFQSDGKLIQSNDSARKFYGLEGIDGTHIPEGRRMLLSDILETSEMTENQDAEAEMKKISSMVPGDKVHEITVLKKTTSYTAATPDTWHRVQIVPTKNPATGGNAILVNESDLSVIKRTERRLVDALNAKEDFFSTVSHEIRTPLHGMLALTEHLMDDEDIEAGNKKLLSTIQACGMQLQHLVQDMLDAAATQSGELVLHRHQEVRLKEIIDTVIVSTEPLLAKSLGDNPESAGVKLKHHLDPDLPTIQGDQSRILQVVSNLVANAVKFTQAGEICIAATRESHDKVKIEVKDTGIGIPHGLLDMVFAPFEQGDMSSTRKYGGTGLGLSLVKSLVEQHGGAINVSSTVGPTDHGSTFSVLLPIVQQNLGDGSPTSVMPEGSIKRKTYTSSLSRVQSTVESQDAETQTFTEVFQKESATRPKGPYHTGNLNGSESPKPNTGPLPLEHDASSRLSESVPVKDQNSQAACSTGSMPDWESMLVKERRERLKAELGAKLAEDALARSKHMAAVRERMLEEQIRVLKSQLVDTQGKLMSAIHR